MFTGIISEVGKVTASARTGGSIRLTIEAPGSVPALRVGSSIAVNGACLTAVEAGGGCFTVDVVEETLTKTALGEQVGRGFVNLELPMKAGGSFDGHIVLGHVDTTGRIERIEDRQESWWFTVHIPQDFMKYAVHTGSITIDGVSLTVADLGGDRCRISIIPHTMKNTLFGRYRMGDRVNVEVDVIGKYVERMLGFSREKGPLKTGMSMEKLKEMGY